MTETAKPIIIGQNDKSEVVFRLYRLRNRYLVHRPDRAGKDQNVEPEWFSYESFDEAIRNVVYYTGARLVEVDA